MDPGEVMMAKDLGIGIIGLQSTQQGDEGVLLGRGAGVGSFAIGIETSLIANANTVGVVARRFFSSLADGADGADFSGTRITTNYP